MLDDKLTFRVSNTVHLRIMGVLAGMTLCLVLLSIAASVITFTTGHDLLLGWIPEFLLTQEANVPTWFSSTTLLLAAVLAGLITTVKFERADPYRRYWLALTCLFLVFSLDETAGFHEDTMHTIRHFKTTHGIFYFAWVIPGIAIMATFFLATLRFWASLPRRFQILFAVSALTYFGGAVGFEMIDGAYADTHGEANITYVALTTIEEALEQVGVLMFISTLLKYVSALGVEVSLRVTKPAVIGEAPAANPKTPLEHVPAGAQPAYNHPFTTRS